MQRVKAQHHGVRGSFHAGSSCTLQEAEAAKEEAEQRFWLPLERSKGRQMGELCVSLLFTKVCVCVSCEFMTGGTFPGLACPLLRHHMHH